jgi:hypothetical protein
MGTVVQLNHWQRRPPVDRAGRALVRLRRESDGFLDLDRLGGTPRLFTETAAKICRLVARIVGCERCGCIREEILRALSAARAVHRRSSFIRRLQTWPRGYRGDFETLEYLIRGPGPVRPRSVAECLECCVLRSACVKAGVPSESIRIRRDSTGLAHLVEVLS